MMRKMSQKLEIERHNSTMSRTRACSPLWKLNEEWQNLPDVIFGDIMMMMGLNSLEVLHRCRQVCQSWNVRIFEMTKYKKDKLRRQADSQAAQIRDKWVLPQTRLPQASAFPSLSELITAASLAQHGLLGRVQIVCMRDVDLASVPAEHLASLASYWADNVYISNVSNLRCFLGGIKCKQLFYKQILNSEETEDLVRAMESGVEVVSLIMVSLDIRALTQYNGQGKCRKVICFRGIADKYKEDLKSWAEKINWTVRLEIDNDRIFIERK